jgi:hypothetical protein
MKAISVWLVIALTVACAHRPPVPRGTEKAAVAIKVTRPRLLEDTSPCGVYFVRLEADNQTRQKRAFEANYCSGDYAYLINANAGRYAAIGAVVYTQTDDPLNPGLGHVSASYWYFPASMIDETIVTVEPFGMAFMGEFEVSGDLQFDDTDDTQKHYFNIFTGSPKPKGGFWHWLLRPHFFIGEYRKDNSEMAMQRFLQSSQPLAKAGWRARTTRASAEDGDNKGISEGPGQQNGDK